MGRPSEGAALKEATISEALFFRLCRHSPFRRILWRPCPTQQKAIVLPLSASSHSKKNFTRWVYGDWKDRNGNAHGADNL